MSERFTRTFFLILAMLASFCITWEFSISKPASTSLFLYHFGAKALPYAWLCTIPLNLLIVKGYNKLLSVMGCWRVFLLSIVSVVAMNTYASWTILDTPWIAFTHYVIKDIYVLLMFQQLWSIIHVTINMKQAKSLYGIIFGVGGLGAVLGSFITKKYAVQLGSEHLLTLTGGIYALFALNYYLLMKASTWHTKKDHLSSLVTEPKKERGGGFHLVMDSPYLTKIMIIVVAMQLSATVVEYQFNVYVEKVYPMKDLRTAFTGMFFGWINAGTVLLQFFGSWICLHFLGFMRSLFFVPSLLTVLAFGNVLLPSFSMVSATYGTIKSLDYSIFRILTEMLYIPLSVEEKFKAKAVIDVFAYRTARGIASMCVLTLQLIAPAAIGYILNVGAFAVLFVWLISVMLIYRSQEERAMLTQSL